MKYQRVKQESLQVGDILHLKFCGDRQILKFEEYKGVLDFVARIAVLSEGGRTNLFEGYYYEVALKGCPFCGGEAFVETILPHKHYIATFAEDYDGGAFVECAKCSCTISADNEQEAIKKWNTRTPQKEGEGQNAD